jgi:hypothetical protein
MSRFRQSSLLFERHGLGWSLCLQRTRSENKYGNTSGDSRDPHCEQVRDAGTKTLTTARSRTSS